MNMVWYDEASAFGDITGVIEARTDALDRLSNRLFGHTFHWNLIRSARGHGKRALQQELLKHAERNPLTAMQVRPIPSVDVEKIRWRCRPPSSPPGSRGSFQDMLGEMLTAMDKSGRFARMQEAYQQMYDARNSVNDSAPSVVDNVNVVTDRIPPHIAALLEPEQGPALVEAIFERKRRAGK
ncbi:hypothetical protein SEA_PUREGLOBE5_9 [Arthrobacter phage Pureglobe5]|nr:hypothetical protein SEA_PUREGLOBE5_9 [Arthrobacter phage Pureglobe5]